MPFIFLYSIGAAAAFFVIYTLVDRGDLLHPASSFTVL
jgi:hypothetical protein